MNAITNNNMEKVRSTLSDVPETMLWTLHNRAMEAKRADSILKDRRAIEIYESIDYNYEQSFGKPDASHAVRSRVFDDALVRWMASHKGGTIINLGEGLETQVCRIDDGAAQWYSVDLPDAIEIRERFITPSERRCHLPKSALDLTWMDDIKPAKDVFVTAQGLFMYFQPEEVERLLKAIVERFPGVTLMFDVIPRWFSEKTMKGFRKTKAYQTPQMPWGINRQEIEPTLRTWSPEIQEITFSSYSYSRGLWRYLFPLMRVLPVLRNLMPEMVYVTTSRPSAA